MDGWCGKLRNTIKNQGEGKVLHSKIRRKCKWLGHILRTNCFWNTLLNVIWGKDRVTGRRGRRRKQLLYIIKETRGYWKFKEETLDCSLWKTDFVEPRLRKTTEIKPTILKCPFSAIVPQMIRSILTHVLSKIYIFDFDNIREYTTKYFLNKTGNLRVSHLTSCCSGKAMSITYSDYVFVVSGVQHLTLMRRIVICGLLHSTTTYYVIS